MLYQVAPLLDNLTLYVLTLINLYSLYFVVSL